MRGVLSSRPVCRSVGRLASPPVVSWPPFHFTEMCPGCCWSAAVCKERPPLAPPHKKNPRGCCISMRTNRPPTPGFSAQRGRFAWQRRRRSGRFLLSLLVCILLSPGEYKYPPFMSRRVHTGPVWRRQWRGRPRPSPHPSFTANNPPPHPPFTPNLPQCCCCCCRGFPALYAACCVSVCVAVVADRRLFCAWSLSGPR